MSITIFAADVSVVIPLRALRPRSRTNTGWHYRGRFDRGAVTQPRPRRPRDAFHRSLFERRFLSEEAAPLGGGSSRIADTSEVTPLRCDRCSRFAVAGSRSLLMRARFSHEASPCPRRADRRVACRSVTHPWGPRTVLQLLPYVFRRTGTPVRALDPPPREAAASVRVRARRPGLRRAQRARLELHDSSSEEPCPLRRSLRPISRPSLSRSSRSRAGLRLATTALRDRARGVPEHAGISRRAAWVAAPKRRLMLAIPAGRSPLLRATADTPCRLAKPCRVQRFSLRGPGRPGGRRCLREDLDLEPRRLREEDAAADGRGAWNPS